ncbi:hypothetical protein FEM48_Zijuj11G0137100 [Ziziphus jujuba var. spinosa]|uniref:DUF4220 domain-containing protein n=1 Tax=Ziziphus jujuba var. spinosa TaxID=714518 RepID=A0A978UJ83_ZIZJJ|nr:hypothetical protein FEM48_Zijuj11G0135700 [Ziziphus jujuba var. spinosa]KAH7514878.1 hypothetical protein FEM48_Zijuj11G0137100 [Ziziphus jujuba var. spinosa]
MSAGYCIFLTPPNNNLWLPTILIFVVGSIKYAERTTALYLASFNHFGDAFRDSEGPEVESTEFDFKLASESDHMDLMMPSYSLFKFSKGLIGGLLLISKLIESSKNLFDQIKNPNVGFNLVEYELSFMYEILHIKVSVVRSRIGFIFRLSSFFSILGAFLLFHFVVVVKDNNEDHEFGGFEFSLTYALLIGAIRLDTISGINLMFSDWILVSNNGLIKRWRKCVPEFVLIRRRWCVSVPQYNMIDYCLNERWIWKFNKFPHCFRVMIDNIKFMLFSSSLPVDDFEQLKRFIFEELSDPNSDSFDEVILSEMNKVNFAKLVLEAHLVTELHYHHRTETDD